jgi:hypothetical protein
MYHEDATAGATKVNGNTESWRVSGWSSPNRLQGSAWSSTTAILCQQSPATNIFALPEPPPSVPHRLSQRVLHRSLQAPALRCRPKRSAKHVTNVRKILATAARVSSGAGANSQLERLKGTSHWGATMKMTATQYTVTVGFAGVLALTAATCSFAQNRMGAGDGRQMSQYCVPEDSPEAHKLYCRNWQLIPMGS